MNLLSKLHRNSILTGPIESYCLACSCLLRSEEESYIHIHHPQHVDKFQALPQLDDYKDDCILKIKEGYFCPICNVILPTIKRISLHVVEARHKENKTSQSITRHGDAIFAFDIVLIDPRSWHGVDGATCTVCNEDYADEKEHLADPGHTLRLIQARCEFGDNFVYRNVDEDLFFCLICNDILSVIDKETHHQSEKHLELYKKSKEQGTVIKNKPLTEVNNNTASNLLELKPKTITGAKNTTNNKTNAEIVKLDNGNTHDLDDNRTTTVADPENLSPSKVKSAKVVTESTNTKQIRHQEPKIHAQVEDVKSKQYNIDTAQSNTVTNDTKEDSEKAKNAAKTSEKINTVDKDNVKVSETKTVTNNIKTKVVEPLTKNCEDKNGTDIENKEPYFYDFIQSRSFVIKTTSNSAYCALCDIPVDGFEVAIHCLNQHHNILYHKHITRKNKEYEKKAVKDNTVTNLVKDKKNVVSVNESTKAQKANKIGKPEAIKDTDIHTNKTDLRDQTQIDKHNQTNFKENLAPANTIENEPEPDIGRHENPTAPLSKKAAKKAQKKTAKLKLQSTSTIKNIPAFEEIAKATAIPHTPVTASETATSKNDTDIVKLPVVKNSESIGTIAAKTDGEYETVANTDMTKIGNKTEKLLTFIKTVSQVDSSPEDIVINCKFVVGNLSFVLLIHSGEVFKCVACDETLTVDVHKHISTETHKLNVEDCFVVTTFADEFIRQLKSGIYHCGYCNMTVPDWDATRAHLETFRHSDAKTSALWRLQRYLPLMKHSEKQEVRSALTSIFRRTMD